jgi:hypothetical protein
MKLLLPILLLCINLSAQTTSSITGTLIFTERDPNVVPSKIRPMFGAVGLIKYDSLTGRFSTSINQSDVDNWNKFIYIGSGGSGARLINILNSDSVTFKSLVVDAPLKVDTSNKNELRLSLTGTVQASVLTEHFAPYTASFTVGPTDVNCYYTGTGPAIVTLPPVSIDRVFYIINQSEFTLTVGGYKIPAYRMAKFNCNGTIYLLLYQIPI